MSLSTAELSALIQSDPEASALFAAGNDTGCAARCVKIAPKELRPTKLGRLGILGLYADPAVGAVVLGTMQAVAAANPVVAWVWDAMAPVVQPENMPDWSLPQIRGSLTVSAESGGIGLTAEQAAPILAAAEYAPTITADEVSAVRAAQ